MVKPKVDKKKTMGQYAKQFYCKNSNEGFTEFFDKGVIAYQPTCPNCGVNPLQLEGGLL